MREGLNWPWLVLVLAVFGIPLFISLGATDVGNDEAIYSYAVDSILETGQWLAPQSSPDDDITFVEKPHLKFWIVAAPIRFGVLPHNEFGLRFWDALFGALTFLYVFLIGRRLAGVICGLFAVIVLFAQTPLLFDHGLRSNNMEAALVLAYCGGAYHFLRWGAGGSHRWRHIAAVAGWFFLGFMTKFVAVVFLPVFLGASALLLPQSRRQLAQDWWRWVLAGVAVVALALPWFLYQSAVLGEWFWYVMFGEHVFNRFTKFIDPEHVQPWHFYISEAYTQLTRTGSVLWVVLGIVILLVHTLRRRTPEGVVVLLWLSVPVALMSLGTSKLYHYFYPYLPPLAIAAGAAVSWMLSAAERRLVAPAWMKRPLSGPLRAAAWTVAALALTLALATAILGTVRIETGSLFFRNSSLLRPVSVALLAIVAAGGLQIGGALAVVLLIPLIVPSPFPSVSSNLRRLTVTDRPLSALADCIRRVDPVSGAYAPVTEPAFRHPYFYYMRGDGWREKVDAERLRTALTVDGRERPVLIQPSDYAEFLDNTGPLPDAPTRVEQPTVLVLLPGRFKSCASVAASDIR